MLTDVVMVQIHVGFVTDLASYICQILQWSICTVFCRIGQRKLILDLFVLCEI